MKHRQLLENNPAFMRVGWIPGGDDAPWDELAELREEHHRLLANRTRTAEAILNLRQAFEREDAERTQAKALGFRLDKKAAKVEVTPDADRESALREAHVEAEAALDALGDFLVEALDALAGRQAEWFADLDEHREVALAAKAEALKLAAEADANAREYEKLRAWLRKAASGNSGLHVLWDDLETPPAEQPIELSSGLAGTGVALASAGGAR